MSDDEGMAKIPGEFGIRVGVVDGVEGVYENGKYLSTREVTRWTVHMPHSRDEWVVTDEQSKEASIVVLRKFISEMQAALKFLEGL